MERKGWSTLCRAMLMFLLSALVAYKKFILKEISDAMPSQSKHHVSSIIANVVFNVSYDVGTLLSRFNFCFKINCLRYTVAYSLAPMPRHKFLWLSCVRCGPLPTYKLPPNNLHVPNSVWWCAFGNVQYTRSQTIVQQLLYSVHRVATIARML